MGLRSKIKETEVVEGEYPETSKNPLYLSSVSSQVGLSLNPFFGSIAVDLGASAAETSWLRSITNLSANLIQPLFGALIDDIRRRVPIVALSNFISVLPIIFLLIIDNPWLLIIMATFNALIISMGVPAWNSLLIESFPEERRGKDISKIAFWGSVGSIISVLVIGFLLTEEYTIWEDILPSGVLTTFGVRSRFFIPIILLIVMSTIGALSLLRYPDTGKYAPLKSKNVNGRIANLKLGFSELKEHKFFTFFLIISFAHAFAMSMSWGLFPQRQRGNFENGGLEATFMEIAILQVIFSITTLFFVGPGGRFSDKVGRVKLIKINRFSLVIFPFWYAFASNVYELAISHILIGSILAFSQAAFMAYLFDIVPKDKRGVYFGIYNSFLGIAYFFGSISGGYLVNLFEYLNYSTSDALKYAFIVVGFVRLVVAFIFLSLKDVRPFPSSFSKEMELLFSRTGSDGDSH